MGARVSLAFRLPATLGTFARKRVGLHDPAGGTCTRPSLGYGNSMGWARGSAWPLGSQQHSVPSHASAWVCMTLRVDALLHHFFRRGVYATTSPKSQTNGPECRAQVRHSLDNHCDVRNANKWRTLMSKSGVPRSEQVTYSHEYQVTYKRTIEVQYFLHNRGAILSTQST